MLNIKLAELQNLPGWSARLHDVANLQKSWLTGAKSLMQRAKHAGVNLTVVPLAEHYARPTWTEAKTLNIDPAVMCFIREVILHYQQPLIRARTIIPLPLLTKQRKLFNLKNRALGKILFANKDFQRLPFEFLQSGNLYLRRSVFAYRASMGLLLTECFLPQFWQQL